jgi:UDP-glucose 4-epimerase
VTPGKNSNRDFEYDVDVNGTRNLLKACVQHGVQRIIVSSSGAAYGYHADNPEWLTESDPCGATTRLPIPATSAWSRKCWPTIAKSTRTGAGCFPHRHHPRPTVRNQITDLFEKPRLLAIAGSDSPFVFIHDQDVVGAILHGVDSDKTGIFNVAGDGKLSIFEIAAAPGQDLPCAASLVAAVGAVGAEETEPDPVRAGAARLPALPPGAAEHASQGVK